MSYHLKIFMIGGLLGALLAYLLFSFYWQSFDPELWSQTARGGCVFIMIGLGVIGGFVNACLLDQEQSFEEKTRKQWESDKHLLVEKYERELKEAREGAEFYRPLFSEPEKQDVARKGNED
jgi:uncharacterized membrane protein